MTIEEEFYKQSKMFSRTLGDSLHKYAGDPGLTFQKDFMMFLYGRYHIINQLMQEFEDTGFALDSAAYHVGSAFGSLVFETIKLAREMGQEGVSDDTTEEFAKLFVKAVEEGYKDKIEMLKNDPNDEIGYPQTVQ